MFGDAGDEAGGQLGGGLQGAARVGAGGLVLRQGDDEDQDALGGAGVTERVTRVSAGTLLDSMSELSKLSSGQTDKSQKVALGSLNQESSGSNAVGFVESVVGAAVRAAVKK